MPPARELRGRKAKKRIKGALIRSLWITGFLIRVFSKVQFPELTNHLPQARLKLCFLAERFFWSPAVLVLSPGLQGCRPTASCVDFCRLQWTSRNSLSSLPTLRWSDSCLDIFHTLFSASLYVYCKTHPVIKSAGVTQTPRLGFPSLLSRYTAAFVVVSHGS